RREGGHDGEGEKAEEREEQAGAHDAPGPEPVGEHAGREGRQRIRPDVADDDPPDGGRPDVEGGGHGGERDIEGAVEPDEQKAGGGEKDGHAPEYTLRGAGHRTGLGTRTGASCASIAGPLATWQSDRSGSSAEARAQLICRR